MRLLIYNMDLLKHNTASIHVYTTISYTNQAFIIRSKLNYSIKIQEALTMASYTHIQRTS